VSVGCAGDRFLLDFWGSHRLMLGVVPIWLVLMLLVVELILVLERKYLLICCQHMLSSEHLIASNCC